MRLRRAIFVAATTAVLALAAGAPANAADSPFTQQKLTLSSTVSTKTVVNDECVAAVSAAIAAGATDASLDLCSRTVTLSTTSARRVTATDLASARGSLSAGEYAELSAAVNAGTLRTKDYRQEQINTTDMEVQYGTFYYDGERAWIKATYRGVRGTHKCTNPYAAGVGVELISCDDSGSTYQRKIYMTWKFSALFKGFPVTWNETYTLNATAQGSLWQ
jgi:hypothetical protein